MEKIIYEYYVRVINDEVIAVRDKESDKYKLKNFNGVSITEDEYLNVSSDEINDKYIRVCKGTDLERRYNIITSDGKKLFKEWQKYISIVDENDLLVKLEGNAYTLIDLEGNKKINLKFNDITYLRDGYYRVISSAKKENILSKEGRLIFKKWYDSISILDVGLFKVEMNGLYNIIDMLGETILTDWVDDISNIYKDKFYVLDNKKLILMDIGGKKIKEIEGQYHSIFSCTENVAVCRDEDKLENFINIKGEFISKEWFDYVELFSNGLGIVHTGFGDNVINIRGKKLFKKDLKYVHYVEEGYNFIIWDNDRKYYLVDNKGKRVTEEGFDDIQLNYYKYHVVMRDGKYNIIENATGQLYFDEWTDDYIYYNRGYFIKMDKDLNYEIINLS